MAAKTCKILEDVHSLSIIKEVQKWPVIYCRNSKERANMHFKTRVWREIAKAVCSDWESCSDAEKDCRVIDLTKRWRNLRDTFKRQIEHEKKIREGHDSKKKPYVYFKHMMFLLPHVTAVDQDTEEAPDLDKYFGTKAERTKRKIEEHFIEESASPPRARKSSDVDEIDEDRHFALSLIPSLKKMCDDDKLIAKMEILKVLRNTTRRKRRRQHEEPEVKIEFVDEGEDVEESTSAGDSE